MLSWNKVPTAAEDMINYKTTYQFTVKTIEICLVMVYEVVESFIDTVYTVYV